MALREYQVNLLFEKEEDYFLVSDDATIIYGIGGTPVAALFDYLESYRDMSGVLPELSWWLR